MEQTKKKTLTVAAAAIAVMALVGVIAYLADASGTIRNIFSSDHSTHLEVEITETDVTSDNGDKEYNVTLGSTADKDPKVSVDTNGDAYVYAIVKDTINNNAKGKKYVDYQIADGWVELDPSTLTDKEIKKYNEIFTDKTGESVVIKPNDPNTRIFYRIVNGTDEESRFEYPVLKDNSISYPTTLTNDDLAYLKSIADDKDRALDFQTYAVQMTPFCPADKVADADATSDEQKGYAAEAWNQKAPAPEATDINNIEVKAHSLTIYPTVPGDEYIVVPKGTDPTEDDWTSTGQKSNGGEALNFDGLDANTEYDVISRTPAASDQGVASDPSEATTVKTSPLAESITVTEKSGLDEVKVGDKLYMVATVEPEDADQDVTWSSSDPSVATVDSVTGIVISVAPGTAKITATAKDGSGVKGEYNITVLAGKFLYQVKLHDVTNGVATFYPALAVEPANWGQHDHAGDCICDHTWAEIANQYDVEEGRSLDFSNCTCTKDVPIETSLDTTGVFYTYASDYRDSAFSTRNTSNANGTNKSGKNGFSHGALINAIKACHKVEGVNVNFRDMSYTEAYRIGNTQNRTPNRILYRADGAAIRWWTGSGVDSKNGWAVAHHGLMGYASRSEQNPVAPIMFVSVD